MSALVFTLATRSQVDGAEVERSRRVEVPGDFLLGGGRLLGVVKVAREVVDQRSQTHLTLCSDFPEELP